MEIYISRVHVSCQRTQQIRDKLDMFTQIRFICADVFDFMSASIQEHTRARVRRHLFHLCDMTYDVSIAAGRGKKCMETRRSYYCMAISVISIKFMGNMWMNW